MDRKLTKNLHTTASHTVGLINYEFKRPIAKRKFPDGKDYYLLLYPELLSKIFPQLTGEKVSKWSGRELQSNNFIFFTPAYTKKVFDQNIYDQFSKEFELIYQQWMEGYSYLGLELTYYKYLKQIVNPELKYFFEIHHLSYQKLQLSYLSKLNDKKYQSVKKLLSKALKTPQIFPFAIDEIVKKEIIDNLEFLDSLQTTIDSLINNVRHSYLAHIKRDTTEITSSLSIFDVGILYEVIFIILKSISVLIYGKELHFEPPIFKIAEETLESLIKTKNKTEFAVFNDINAVNKYLIEGAERGNTKFQTDLGTFILEERYGFKKNPVLGLKWLMIAANNGDRKAATNLKIHKKRYSGTVIREAEEEAEKFKF